MNYFVEQNIGFEHLLINDFSQKTLFQNNDITNIEYKLNNHNYRSKNFSNNTDIMTLGCSHTFGVGLPEEFIWPNLLGKKLNTNVVNLARPGDSAQGQIRKAFYYFNKFGNPKTIVCLFPLYRMDLPSIPNKLNAKSKSNKNNKNSIYIQHVSIDPNIFDKYSKVPHDPEFVLPVEVSIFYTHMFIEMLEQYCKSNNIKLIWSIWQQYENIYNYLKNINPEFYLNYCNLSTNSWSRGEKKNCCKSEHYLFDMAADRNNNQFPHWGIHRHQHIADEIYERIIK